MEHFFYFLFSFLFFHRPTSIIIDIGYNDALNAAYLHERLTTFASDETAKVIS